MRAWGRLLRLSLAPTAAADVAAGIVAAGATWPESPAPWLLVAASLCVYHGGMALNDWADREENRRSRPDRPIPSGAIAPGAALALAVALLLLGPALAFLAGPRCGTALLAVAALAALYDLVLRGPWIGPLALAACRAGNLSAGILLVAPLDRRLVLVPILYGGYVFFVSRLGRLEDAPDEAAPGRAPSAYLAAAALCLLAAPVAGRGHARWFAGLLAAAGAFGLVRAAARSGPWKRADVLVAMGLCLRRLLVFTAAVALSSGSSAGWVVAAAILAGYPLAYALRGVFPPS